MFTEAPGTTSLAQHHIKLTSDQPVPYSLRESLKKDITDMMKMGVIRELRSPYASPVVVVKKKDNTNRVCVNYRRLNKLTVFDPEPMPTAERLVLPYKRLLGMCRWMGSHFHDWTDYNGVAYLVQLIEWDRTFLGRFKHSTKIRG